MLSGGGGGSGLRRAGICWRDRCRGCRAAGGARRDAVQVVLGVRLEQNRQVGGRGRGRSAARIAAVDLPAVHERVG